MDKPLADFQKSEEAERQNPFRATAIWNALVKHVRSEVQTKRRRWKLQYFDDCFRGCDIVRVLQSYVERSPQVFKDVSRSQLRSFCQILQDRNVIKPVQNANVKESNFEDGNKLYRFVEESRDEHKSNSCDRRTRTRSYDRVLRPILGNTNRNSTENCNKRLRRRSADEFLQSGLPELPLKKRRRSLDSESSIRKLRMLPQTTLTVRHTVKTTYQKICLSNLLRLLDVSFLEKILDGLAASECYSGMCPVFTDDDQETFERELSPLVNREVSGRAASVRNQLCKVAHTCFNIERKSPLQHSTALGFPNLSNFTESEIVQILSDYFVSMENSLIPPNLIALVDEVIRLHNSANSTGNTLQALQLLLVLIPVHNRKHLEQLLYFIELTRKHGQHVVVRSGIGKRFFIRKFVSVIFPSGVRNKDKAVELVVFMMKEWKRLFLIPSDIKKEVARQCSFHQRGNDCSPLMSTTSSCHQISLEEYEHQKQYISQECLNSLICHIIEDVNLSLKEKEDKVSLFQRYHSEVFLLQFPDGKF